MNFIPDMKIKLLSLKTGLAAILLIPFICSAELTIASLNPVITDIARQVGGEHITVIELMKPGENPHVYEPTPEQLRKAHETKIILAAGMGLETYLPDLRDTLREDQQIIEIGKTIPSLTAEYSCPHGTDHGHDHHHKTEDPHWWHSIHNLQRATLIISEILCNLSPENEDYFKAGSRKYRNNLDKLNSWTKKQLYKIPRKNRILTTSHASFGYFCQEFGFTAIPIQGLSSEVSPDPKQITAVIETIRKDNIKAIFPEKGVNPKLLETIIRETGVKQGGNLLAAGPAPEAPTCEAMMRHNVETIVKALTPEK